VPYSSFQIQRSPTALQRPYGRSWMRAHGGLKDYYLGQAKQAVQQRFPSLATTDALGALGSERLIDRGAGPQVASPETDAAYAERLRTAWDLWYWGGTAYGLLTALAAQGYSPVIICQNGQRHTVSGGVLSTVSGTPWTFDPPNLWNTFLVLFPTPPSSWTNIQNPPTSSSAPTADEVARLVRTINLWKPAHAICAGIQVVTSGRIWGYGWSWGSGVWGGATTVFPVPSSPP
jgi:hypothetical protein